MEKNVEAVNDFALRVVNSIENFRSYLNKKTSLIKKLTQKMTIFHNIILIITII